MKKVFIVQARMTSTRLPGKVMMDLAGKPMLAQQIQRLKRCATADEILIATTTNAADEPIIELARQEGLSWFRGSEHDVLGRYVGAARQAHAEVVVRITADCPLIDPEIADSVVRELIGNSSVCDYSSNVVKRTYPQGLDTEALFIDTLERVHRLASSPSSREHVTVFIYKERPDLFVCRSVSDSQDNSHLRWTVDTAEDLDLVRGLYRALDLGNKVAPYSEILAYAQSQTITLQPALEKHIELLWHLANDPVVRQASFNTAFIAWEEHRKWFSSKLKDPSCFLFIALDPKNVPLGQIRFDLAEKDAEVSVSISREYRGLGYGSLLISYGVRLVRDSIPSKRVSAFVKPGNLASIRAFQKAGFTNSGVVIRNGQPALQFVWEG